MKKSLNGLIGFFMRLYRRSFLYPRAGKLMAKWLSVLLGLTKDNKVVKNIGGINFELDLTQVIDVSLYYSGVFEENAENIINKYTDSGMTVIDIGANFGYHTFRMAEIVGQNGKVLAFEPTTWAFQKLMRNLELNDFKNIIFHKIALSDQDLGPVQVAFQSSYPLVGKPENQVESIMFHKLDTIISEDEFNRIDFIKLDVDGFESKVLLGAISTIKKFNPIILFEFSPIEIRNNGDDPLGVLNLLVSFGYKLLTDTEKEILDLVEHSNKIGEKKVSNMLLAIPKIN